MASAKCICSGCNKGRGKCRLKRFHGKNHTRGWCASVPNESDIHFHRHYHDKQQDKTVPSSSTLFPINNKTSSSILFPINHKTSSSTLFPVKDKTSHTHSSILFPVNNKTSSVSTLFPNDKKTPMT